MASLAEGIASWWGGDRLVFNLPGAAAPLASVALTSPAAAAATGGTGKGGFPLILGQTVAFLPPLDPATTAATCAATDASGSTQTVNLSVFGPLYGSYTFALRGYLPITWDAGPRAMTDVPPGGETAPSIFASLTSALAEGLNLFGGTPLTRLTADSAVGATSLPVERAAGLMSVGTAQVDGVPYTYDGLAAGPASPSLSGISLARGGGKVAGTQAFHAAGAQVAYSGAATTDLVRLKNALFLDTAEGPFLTAIGRYLGVDHSPAIADDDQYRALVKAIAYGPKTSVYGISLALDALLGAGTYSLREDPTGAPCQVLISVPYTALGETGSRGRSYIQDYQAATPAADGSIPLTGPVVGLGPVYALAAGGPERGQDLALLRGNAATSTSATTLSVAGAAVPAPLITPPVTPLPTDVGALVDLEGGTQPGRYRVAEVRGGAWAVHQGIYPGCSLASAAGGLLATVPVPDGAHVEQVGPFVYPRDLGRTIAVAGKTGAIAAILNPTSRADLASFATPVVQRSNLAVVSGLNLSPQSAATLAVLPNFATATSVPYRAPRAYVASADANPTLTRRAPLTSPPAQVAACTSSVLSAIVMSSPSATANVVGNPPALDINPLYIDAPFAVLDAYLSDLTAAGVAAVVDYS